MKFKKNNKGFSLVELIIVIAIMVALVAVLAPQFTKYVEKSRIASDENMIQEVVDAVKVAAVDEEQTIKSGKITLSKDAAPDLGATEASAALTEYFGSYADAKLKSAKYAKGVEITVAVTTDKGTTVTWAPKT